MQLRFAVPSDAGALLRIYDEYINTSITFEYALPGEAEFAARIADISAEYPYLALFDGGVPAAYAYAHPRTGARGLRLERGAFDLHCTGVCRARTRPAALRGIDGAAAAAGRKNRLRRCHQPEPGERGAAPGAGLHVAARFHDAGWKDGAWHDVTWFEREIAPHDGAPKPLRPIGEVGADEVLHVCEQAICERFAK